MLRAAFEAHGGEEQGTEGDSFFVTFPTASHAVAAAIQGQRSLATHPWPHGAPVRVRIGVHVGEIQTIAGTIIGMAVHEAARIGAAAHGGQILVSAITVELAGELDDGAGWIDVGGQLLKDISAPLHLFQVTHPQLASQFPPPRSNGASRNNLPAQASPFVGRTREVADVAGLLVGSRLVTVTGAGGAGKSRVALRAASEQGSRFADGVWFVDLAPVSDGSAIAQHIASALGLPDLGGAHLAEAIGQRTLLLLIDNCEHLVEAVCEVVDDLLRRCPGLAVLATSREPLGIQGESAWRLPSLDDDDAVELFRVRATAVNSRFSVTDANRSTVRDVCRRLDSIPLALELAAARLESLSVEQLASRLNQRFRLLSGGARGAMARQRTLQATVDWSYDLLDQPAQTVLRRLGTFVGGFTLEAAEAVCATEAIDDLDVLDLVDQLVTKSLVIAEEQAGEVRYRLMETIRHYALDRLLQAGETADARNAHLAWASRLAADAEPGLWFAIGDTDWLKRLDADSANMRAAFDWAVEGDEEESAAAMLVATLTWFVARSRYSEGLELCDRLRAAGDDVRPLAAFCELMLASHGRLDDELLARCRRDIRSLSSSSHAWLAPMADGALAAWSIETGDEASLHRAIAACQAAGEAARDLPPTVFAFTLQALAWAYMEAGDLKAAETAATRGLALMSEVGWSIGQSRLSANLAHIAIRARDLDAAWGHAERTVEFARRTSDTWMVIAGTHLLSHIAARRGDLRSARDLAVSLLGTVAEAETDQALADVHRDVAWYALLDGDIAVADSHAKRAVELVANATTVAGTIFSVAGETARCQGDLRGAWDLHLRGGRSRARTASASSEPSVLASVIEGLAAVRLLVGDAQGAATLLGSAAAHRPDDGNRLKAEITLVADTADAARANLGDSAYRRALTAGSRLDLDSAFALCETMPSPA